jgi:hypothetical protein
MTREITFAIILGGLSMLLLGAGGDAELEAYLAAQKRQLDDPRRDVAERARIAREMAETLDRAAQRIEDAGRRRALWAEAATLLEGFTARYPRHPQASAFTLQAAVYHWAQARSWMQQLEPTPTDTQARDRARAALGEAISRLQPLAGTARGPDDPLTQNVRYRLAQALADRATLDAEDPDAARLAREQALERLGRPVSEAGLEGFANLLRADLLAALGRFDRAQDALDAAATARPPPPVGERLAVQTAIAIGRKRFDEALRAIEAAPLDAPAKGQLAVRVLLAQRDDLPSGPERAQVEAEAFRRVGVLRAAGRPEARLALLTLARSIAEPAAAAGPDAWEMLAEGCLALGDLDRAGRLALVGAAKAEARGQWEVAGAMRYRAGAILFQAGQFARADPLLTRVRDEPRAGPWRPKASLLRVLARGRIADEATTDAARTAYREALEAHLHDFPDDPTAAEARWLLGQDRLAAGDDEPAVALWSAIPRGSARWLAARLAIAGARREAIEARRVHGDPKATARQMDEARRSLDETLAQAQDASERTEVELGRVHLELIPGLGRPEEALRICDRLLESPGLAGSRQRARLLRVVALALLGRSVDAASEARAEAGAARVADVLAAALRLDRAAAAAETDLMRRRLGQITRLLADRVLARPADLSPTQRSEARIRQARAILFSGDPQGAAQALEAGAIEPEALAPVLLADLAELDVQLGRDDRAIAAYHLLARRHRPGTLPWFEARYALALAYDRSGQPDQARQLVEGTAILHPDLGGGSLREKFERLRRRLGRG